MRAGRLAQAPLKALEAVGEADCDPAAVAIYVGDGLLVVAWLSADGADFWIF
jgi:hypothetical protein